jgi:hypothetical protein
MLSKSNAKMCVLRIPPHYLPSHMYGFATRELGEPNACTGKRCDRKTVATQQTLIWSACILEHLNHTVKVLKLAKQITVLMVIDPTTLAPMGATFPAKEVEEIETHYGMYVPWKYLPMILESRLMPKEELCRIGMEATSQGVSMRDYYVACFAIEKRSNQLPEKWD